MIPSFTTDLTTINTLYSAPNSFRTPAFQRPYSWTTKEAGQLLEDIRQAAETGHGKPSPQTADYFLGTIVLLRAGAGNGATSGTAGQRKYDIIDGQQRLVTLTILLAVLRDLDAGDKGVYTDRIQAHINADPEAAPRQHPYRILLDGMDGVALASYVQVPASTRVSPEVSLDSVGSKRMLEIRDHFHDELHDLNKEDRAALVDYLLTRCAFVVIATSDIDRAYQMFTVLNHRGKPLDRADIIKARLIGALPHEEHERFSKQWTELQETFGSKYETLFSHIRTIHGHHHGRIVSGLMEIVSDVGGARRFIDSVVGPMAGAYKRIVSPDPSDPPEMVKACSRLPYLNWLRAKDWMPSAMLWMSRHSDDPEKIGAFLTALDRLAYGLLLLGMGTVKRKNRYRAVLKEIREGVSILTNPGPLALSRDEQRNILYNVSHNLHGRSQQACKLALLRLNDEIAGAPQILKPGDFTVEHILPLKLSSKSLWREWYPSADSREYCTQCLGNLTLIHPRANDRAGNKDFADKLEVYFPDDTANGTHLTEMLRGLPDWREERVMERDAELLERIKDLWKLSGPVGRKDTRLQRQVSKPARQPSFMGIPEPQVS